ncbi:MAG: TolC family protein, partial [Syntrophobacteraceae bacterium]
MRIRFPGYIYFFICLLSGCASSPVSSNSRSAVIVNLMEPAPIHREGSSTVDSVPTESIPDPTGVITLRDALSLALMKNPELAATSLEIRASEARALQAGVVPNPVLGATVEEFGGDRILKNFNFAETTVQLSQLIELGGKRAKRMRLAQLEKDLAGWDYEVKRLDVLTEVSKSFVAVLAAQEQEALTSELVLLAEQVFNSVSERVKAGKISPLEETKSFVALSNAKIEWEKARSVLKTSRYKLAATLGQESPTFKGVEGALDEVKAIPSLDEIRELILRNPDVARYVKELEQRSAALAVQEAKRIPDVTVSGGAQRFNEYNENAFVVGIAIPIPIFDRNQGGILEAKHKLSKATEEYRAAKVKANSRLGEAFQSLS